MEYNKPLHYFDITDFAAIVIALAGVVLGDLVNMYMLGQIMTGTAVGVVAFQSGRIISLREDGERILLHKMALYLPLYLLMGVISDLLRIDGKRMLQAVADIITTTKVPTGTPAFFLIVFTLATVCLLARFKGIFNNKKPLWILLGVALLALPCIVDEEAVGYCIMAAFIGGKDFNQVHILSELLFFLAGIYSVSSDKITGKKLAGIFLVTSIIGLVAYVMDMKSVASILMGAFIVYIACCVCTELKFFQFLLGVYDRLAEFILNVFRGINARFSTGGRKNLPVYLLVYTVVFAVVAYFTFIIFKENNLAIIWRPDAISLYIPKAYSYSEYWREAFTQMLHGNFSLNDYDFRIGMGEPVAMSFEPLYMIFALFKPANVELAYQVVLVVRFYFAGLAASALFLYLRRSNYEALMGSIIYAFCGFSLAEGVRHAHFLGPMIFLPLLILMTEEIIRKRRWWLCPPLIALSLMNGYYFHYINTLLIIIYYLVRYATVEDKSIKDFFVTSFKFAGLYILGVVIGNKPLTTTFASYLGSSRSGSSLIATDSLLFYSKSYLKKCIASFISLPDSPAYLMRFGFAAIVLIAIIVMVLRRRDNKLFAALFVVLTLMCLFPFVGFVFNGFGAVINRWTYAYALMASAITVYMLPKLSSLSRRELRSMLYVIVPYILYLTIDREFRSMSTAFACGMLVANYAVILLMNKEFQVVSERFGRIALLSICCLCIIFNGYNQYTVGEDTTPDCYPESGSVVPTILHNPTTAFKGLSDKTDTIERVGSTVLSINSSNSARLSHVYGITEYNNTINSNINKYLGTMGTSTQSTGRFNGFNNRTMLNALANVKYYGAPADTTMPLPYGLKKIGTYDDKANNDKYIKYENTMALPFGYTYDRVISEDDLLNYDVVDRQEVMMNAATVSDADTSSASKLYNSAKIETGTSKLKILAYELHGATYTNGTLYIPGEKATVKLYFNAQPGKELYMKWSGEFIASNDERDTFEYIKAALDNGITQQTTLLPYNNAYYNKVGTYLYHMGYQEESVKSITLNFTTNEDEGISEDDPQIVKIDDFGIYQQAMDSYPGYIRNLSENVLQDVTVGNDTVTGKLTVDKDKLLVLSLPYQKGWTAYVDGKKAEIERADLMYMGIMVDKGHHDIRFEYNRPGRSLSWILTIAGIIVFIGMVVFYRKRHTRR